MMIKTNGAMRIGGIKTTPTGFTTTTKTGRRLIRGGSIRMAPMTRSISGIMANGGTTRILVG
jgi:hypothetical protein